MCVCERGSKGRRVVRVPLSVYACTRMRHHMKMEARAGVMSDSPSQPAVFFFFSPSLGVSPFQQGDPGFSCKLMQVLCLATVEQ